MNKGEMKIDCESHRDEVVLALIKNGYKVWVDIRSESRYIRSYFVMYEKKK